MAQAFTPGLQLKRRALVRRRRELPVPGEILFKEHAAVRAEEIVARALLPGELQIVRLAEKMGIEPFEVMKGLKVKEGDSIKAGDLLCEHCGIFGLFRSRFVSPVEGRLELVNERTGHLAVRGEPSAVTVSAYISGTVASVEPGKSVTIQTEAAYVQGIFGVGGERRGRLKILKISSDHVLQAEDIPGDVAGCVLAGGTSPSLEALRAASANGAVGMVVGSIDDQALAGYLGFDVGIAVTGDEDIAMTLIVTEGFGRMPISERVMDLLVQHDDRQVSINGTTQVRAGAVRPEILVSLPPDEQAPAGTPELSEETHLAPGRSIRIIRVPYFGKRARVVSLPHAAQRIETGAFARVLEAELENGERVIVPRANVELI